MKSGRAFPFGRRWSFQFFFSLVFQTTTLFPGPFVLLRLFGRLVPISISCYCVLILSPCTVCVCVFIVACIRALNEWTDRRTNDANQRKNQRAIECVRTTFVIIIFRVYLYAAALFCRLLRLTAGTLTLSLSLFSHFALTRAPIHLFPCIHTSTDRV